MATFLRTSEFDAWLKALRDPIGKARILARIRALVMLHLSAVAFWRCGSMSDPVTRCISVAGVK